MIYFDNAATSFPKPPAAIEEALCCMRNYGGNAGRGAHRLSLAAAEKIYACRELLSDFFGLHTPERIIFTQNTTYALNIAIKGLLRAGSHVLISELEHNAVRRPLAAMEKRGRITYDVFPVVGLSEDAIIQQIATRITPCTAAVICAHTSNICSLSLPIHKIGALCRQVGLCFILDAAQSAGHLQIDMTRDCIDALAAPAHKGLLGIQGAGILALGEGVCPSTLIEGGSGYHSLSLEMPAEFPERYEAGTLPTPAIASLLGGVSFLKENGVENLQSRAKSLFLDARERVESLQGFEIYQRDTPGAVLLFNKRGVPATELARWLDKNGICTRAGLHCAPLAHKALGTPEGGAVRLGFGPFNTKAELDTLWRVLEEF